MKKPIKLLPEYLSVVSGVQIDQDIINEITPVSVYILSTTCSSVYDHYLDSLSDNIRNRTSVKHGVTSLLRLLLECGTEESMSGMAPVYLKRYSESEGALPVSKLKDLSIRMVEAHNRGCSVIVSPRYEYRRSGYRKDLVSGVDVCIDRNGEVELLTILKSDRYTEDSAPAISPRSLLLKILMYLNENPGKTKITYTLLTAGSETAPDTSFVLNVKDLTEPAEVTIERMLTWFGKDRKSRGKMCATCQHRSYCPVLRAELEAQADKLKKGESDEPV